MRGGSLAVLGCVLAIAGATCGVERTDDSSTTGAATTTSAAEFVPTSGPPTSAVAPTTDAPESTAAGTTTTAAPDADPLLVETDLGLVRGAPSGVPGVRAFRAMPYAAPPTGDARWLLPQPRAPYPGVLDATEPGGACPQGPAEVPMLVIPPSVDDCLTVSVWSPDDARDLPVIVWIHGGTLRVESAEDPLTVGDRLASHGAVVVGVNYRLGPLGWLSLDELAAMGIHGNQGFADQVAALEWVRRNIAAFGGDPDSVTLVGESAGGAAVCGHLVSPASAGLFHRAVVQSPTLGLGPFPRQLVDVVGGCDRVDDPSAASARGREYLAAVGCDDLECLRALGDEELLAVAYSPTIVDDGVLVDGTAVDAARSGALDEIPVLLTSNGTEATLFTLGVGEPDDRGLRALFAEVSDRPDELLALYPPSAGTTGLGRYRQMLTDARFACRNLAFAEAATGPTFVVLHDYDPGTDPFGVGPTHGTELIPLFGHPDGIVGLNPVITDPILIELSEAMQLAWVRFASTGHPGPSFVDHRDDRRITVMDDPVRLTDEVAGGRCDVLLELTR